MSPLSLFRNVWAVSDPIVLVRPCTALSSSQWASRKIAIRRGAAAREAPYPLHRVSPGGANDRRTFRNMAQLRSRRSGTDQDTQKQRNPSLAAAGGMYATRSATST